MRATKTVHKILQLCKLTRKTPNLIFFQRKYLAASLGMSAWTNSENNVNLFTFNNTDSRIQSNDVILVSPLLTINRYMTNWHTDQLASLVCPSTIAFSHDLCPVCCKLLQKLAPLLVGLRLVVPFDIVATQQTVG